MGTVTVAGSDVPDPLSRILQYVAHYPKTLRKYDLGEQGDPHALTANEVERTRIINSRISDNERDRLLAQAAGCGQLWHAVPPDAQLANADPAVVGGLYDHALALFRHFVDGAGRGIAWAKTSKVLHLKRPGFFPILDSHLAKAYRQQARAAARRYRSQRPGLRLAYWAAIREDLTSPKNVTALNCLRRSLRRNEDELVRRVAGLSDVRLLDILTWQSQR